MDDAKRRALIRSKAAKKKDTGDVAYLRTGPNNPSVKRNRNQRGTVQPRRPKYPWNPS